MTEPKQARPSPRKGQPAPRYKKADVDRKVLDLIIDHELVRGKPITYRELSVGTNFGMWVLHGSVARLREKGALIPGVPGRHGFLIAVKDWKE